MFSFASLSAAPGERAHGYVDVAVKGVDVRLPAFVINGTGDGKTLLVSAGIHGGEYPCVEAAVRLGRTIDPTGLNGQLVVLPSANPIAFRARSIYVTPVDGLNLNREFPGDPEGSFTQAWAAWLFEHAISQCDMYVDMHGGDMIEALIPFVSFNLTGNDSVDRTARRMAEAYGIRAMLVKRDAGALGGTTYAAAAQAGIPALLTEAGGQGICDEESVEILNHGVRRILHAFEMYPLDAPPPVSDPGETASELGGWEWLRADDDGLFYPTVSVGDSVSQGQNVGHIADFFGDTVQTVVAPVSGEVLFLVTALAMNANDPLMAIAYS